MIENIETTNILIVISSPSGAGKTSICKDLLDDELTQELTLELDRDLNIDYIFISSLTTKGYQRETFLNTQMFLAINMEH